MGACLHLPSGENARLFPQQRGLRSLFTSLIKELFDLVSARSQISYRTIVAQTFSRMSDVERKIIIFFQSPVANQFILIDAFHFFGTPLLGQVELGQVR